MKARLVLALATVFAGAALAANDAQRARMEGSYYADGGDRALLSSNLAPGESQVMDFGNEFPQRRRIELIRSDQDMATLRLLDADGKELFSQQVGRYAASGRFRLADCGGRFVVETDAGPSDSALPCG